MTVKRNMDDALERVANDIALFMQRLHANERQARLVLRFYYEAQNDLEALLALDWGKDYPRNLTAAKAAISKYLTISS